MGLPIYIVSRANPERMHTPELLRRDGVKFTLVVDDNEQVNDAKKLGYKAVSTDTTDLVSKRNAITDMVKRGQWYVGMDDNIRGFSAVNDNFRSFGKVDTSNPKAAPWRKLWNEPVTPTKYVELLTDLTEHCHDVGAEYGGVATMENPFFRMKRFGYRRFVKSKVFVMKGGSDVRFKHRLCHDSYASAHAVALHGTVVTDSFMFYDSKWYEKGGLGSRQQREEAGLLDQLQQCVDEFPGLVGLARGQNSALRFIKTSARGVDAWRARNGWIKE